MSPAASRPATATTLAVPRLRPAWDGVRERAVSVLTDPALTAIVDLVAWRNGDDLFVANAAGRARTTLAGGRVAGEPGEPGTPTEWVTLAGRNPVGNEDVLYAIPLAAALADPSPPNERNAYPFAAARLAQAFLDPARAPDLVVVPTPRHFRPDYGGHLGEHGSLDAVQSRGPLILSGVGVDARGVLPRAARITDVAPTLARLCGTSLPTRRPGATSGLDDLVVPAARHVVALLWDGANCSDLLDLVAAGELPQVARLLERGLALAGGVVAEFPSVTLANHTSALTGVGPGVHGILANEFVDRPTNQIVYANDETTWHRACDLLRPGVPTLWDVLGGERSTACVNEPVDRGAGYSTLALVRGSGSGSGAAGLRHMLPDPRQDRHADQHWVAADAGYSWSAQVDALGLVQMHQLWAETEPPDLTWWNVVGTDAGHHAGGPYSPQARAALRDADRRLGEFLDLLDSRRLTGQTTIVLLSDHGSEATDPACQGSWSEPLEQEGISVRDAGPGFVYFGA